MASIFNIDEWFKELFQDIAKSSVNNFVEAVQQMPEKAEKYLTETPESFSGTIFSMIREVSIQAIVPIAIIILTMVVCYDFISQFMNKSARDMNLEIVMKLCLKLGIGIFLLNHVFDLTTGVFELGTSAVSRLVSALSGSSPDFAISAGTFASVDNKVQELNIGECMLVWIMGLIGYLIQLICNIFVQVICISRMLEIYIYCSVCPIPIATLTNREWGGIGTNFIKNLFALAFQAFMMEICIAIFNSMIAGAMSSESSLIGAMFECLVMGVMLCFTMFKCGSISKSIFNAM